MEKTNNLISVIIPNYNGANYIKECLVSVINQTYSQLEIIVVDDGSTDNSWDIITDIAKSDKRIQCFKKTNTGVSDTRNYALDKATGEYVSFVDSDDFVELDMYESIIDKMLENDSDVLITDFWREKNSGRVIHLNTKQAILEMNYGKLFMGHTVLKVFKRSLCQNVRFDTDINVCEDLLFYHNVFINARRIEYYDKGFYHRRIHSTSAMSSRFNIKFLTCHLASERIVHFFELHYPDKMEYAYLTLVRNNLLILKKIALSRKDIVGFSDTIFSLRNEIKQYNRLVQSLYFNFQEKRHVFYAIHCFWFFCFRVRISNYLKTIKKSVVGEQRYA